MRLYDQLHEAMLNAPRHPGWVAPDVLVDDLRAWADRGREYGLSRRTIRHMRRIADLIERVDGAL